MRCVSNLLLGLGLLASVHGLTKRDHNDRCPSGQQAVTKPNNIAPSTNGCGTGILAGKLPEEDLFHECCNAHDRCYGKTRFSNVSIMKMLKISVGTCSANFDDCNDSLLDCMSDQCQSEYKINVLKLAICESYVSCSPLVYSLIGSLPPETILFFVIVILFSG